MAMNRRFSNGDHVPVIHISSLIDEYLAALLGDACLGAKPSIALGGVVPNLLRSPKARPYQEILASVIQARRALSGKRLHLFGVGGTATLHLAALLGIDSVDSSGWRNRAARGIVQLPGRGDRMVATLGSWRGREPDQGEWAMLDACRCPACQAGGLEGLRARRIDGFCHRATHNLWTLLEEARQIEGRLAEGTYPSWYATHVQNSIYRPLIDYMLDRTRCAL
jgi:queuine/archaeosine tRNA-ribosyltransferase